MSATTFSPENLLRRLRPFLSIGLIRSLPTRAQIFQGELAMLPYVLSSDVTTEEGYSSSILSHPLVRQPLIFAQVGLDHLETGCALGVRLESVCTHLVLTYHRGMPVFDLQVIQTHEHGLDRLESLIEDVRQGGATPGTRRKSKLAARMFARPDEYFDMFLGAQGFIARARRFDYPSAREEGCTVPPEFFSLAGLLDHCAAAYPARLRDIGWARVPGHLFRLATRRFREDSGELSAT